MTDLTRRYILTEAAVLDLLRRAKIAPVRLILAPGSHPERKLLRLFGSRLRHIEGREWELAL